MLRFRAHPHTSCTHSMQKSCKKYNHDARDQCTIQVGARERGPSSSEEAMQGHAKTFASPCMDESLNVHETCTSSALIRCLMRTHSPSKPCRCTPYTRTRKPSVSHSIKMNLDEIALTSYSCDTLTPLLYALSSRRSARIVSRMRDIGVGLRVNAREVAGRPLSIPLKRASPPLVYK